MHSALIRKDCLDKVGGFNETLLHCEDYELWLRISYEGYQFYYLDKVLALYRKRKGAMTADYAKQHEYTIKAYESAYNFLDNKKLRLNLQIVKLLVYLDYLLIKIGYTQQGIIACLTSDIIFLWKTPGSLFRKLVGRFLRFFHNLHRIA